MSARAVVTDPRVAELLEALVFCRSVLGRDPIAQDLSEREAIKKATKALKAFGIPRHHTQSEKERAAAARAR